MARSDDFGFHRDGWILGGLAAFWALIFILGMSACATAPGAAAPQSNAINKFDMHGTVNGIPFDGAGVIPRADRYDVKIQSRVDVDLLTVQSCHRDFSAESAIELGWFQSKRGYDYPYAPVPDLEAGRGSCILRFGSYNKASATQNAWGLIDFEDQWHNMPGVSYCNAAQTVINGIAVCQSRVGLMQMITFPEPMEIAKDVLSTECVPTPSADKRKWVYTVQTHECVISFQEIESPHRLARLTHLGYNNILIRGN